MLDVSAIQCATDTANWHELSSLINPYHSCLLTDPRIDLSHHSMAPLFLPTQCLASAPFIWHDYSQLSECFWFQSESNIKATSFAFDMLDEFRQSRKFVFWSSESSACPCACLSRIYFEVLREEVAMERRLVFLCGSPEVGSLWLPLSPQSKLYFMKEQHHSDRGEISFDLKAPYVILCR